MKATNNYHSLNPETKYIPGVAAYLAKKAVVRNHWTAHLTKVETPTVDTSWGGRGT